MGGGGWEDRQEPWFGYVLRSVCVYSGSCRTGVWGVEGIVYGAVEEGGVVVLDMWEFWQIASRRVF